MHKSRCFVTVEEPRPEGTSFVQMAVHTGLWRRGGGKDNSDQQGPERLHWKDCLLPVCKQSYWRSCQQLISDPEASFFV